ncbi:hypothetical protein B0H94_11124 [Salsuginibacillus halophilus]|uniref:CNNM transmembrane domain-containing protein n=2 Tax=Salsuginibacillus halophilus TaxID=517424 RepID=A0A2P8HAH5_9BACI|nr:hypothetical protein B0H94_11124 [Salsuginibacillus halophilus]
MVVVFIIVFIGVFFDTIGIAATAAEETPFNAMAANKVPGGRHGVLITKHADRFASFCNDVIGDIAGIISGTASAFVVLQLTFALGENEGSVAQTIISMVFTSVVAALTVGGKSFGKTVAIYYSTPIIYHVGKVLYILETKLHIRVFPKRKKRK